MTKNQQFEAFNEADEETSVDTLTGEIVKGSPHPQISQSYAEALALAETIEDWELVDKKDLVGLPFVVVAWQPRLDPITSREYLSIYGIDRHDRHFVFNDGGTGICSQLGGFVQGQAIACKKGLRASSYVVDGPEGPIHATTFYLA